MKWPLQIIYRKAMPSAEVEEWIRNEAEKLDTFYNHVISCRVVVEIPHRHHRKGDAYHVHIGVKVPGGEIVVNREPSLANDMRHLGETAATKHTDLDAPQRNLQLAIKAAFRAVERRLQDYARCQRGDVKLHKLRAEDVEDGQPVSTMIH
jgi:hypothetical protein